MFNDVKIKQLIQLEEKYINQKGKDVLSLVAPSRRQKLDTSNNDFIDEDDLICHVSIEDSGVCEVVKVCSRLSLFSVTTCSRQENLAQAAINTTGLWFDGKYVVVATGEAMLLEEGDNCGIYKLKVQIQRWR